jgi:nucleotide-binding universal stress UspA family protein
MTYKTILVHLNSERHAQRVLDFAVALSAKFNAHLIGLHVFPAFRITPPVPLPYGKDIAGAIRQQIHDEALRIRTIFGRAIENQSFVPEWRSITTEHGDVAKVVLNHARSADLVIACQADPDWDFSDILDCPDRLALGCGRPVIVVPRTYGFTGLPTTIAIGWNGSREAARAVFDALPLLQLAETVHVLSVDEGPIKEGALPDTELAASLSRHGVRVAIERWNAPHDKVAAEFQARALGYSAGLIVMGAYGHARLREIIFGGMTQRSLHEMAVPVLYSH